MNELLDTENTNELVLTIPEQEFAKIILDFLGSKETISKNFEVPFCVDLESLKQFHYLLSQKMERENLTKISLFSAKIRYSDNSERTLTSFESFESYYEQRNVVPTSISMNWSIVLGFDNAKTVETQKISLTLAKSERSNEGEIILNIEHTNQSWGFEIYKLFESQIEKIIFHKSTNLIVYEFFKKYGILKKVYVFFFMTIVFAVLVAHTSDLRILNEKYLEEKNVEISRLSSVIEEIKNKRYDDHLVFILDGIWGKYKEGTISDLEREEALDYLTLFSREQGVEYLKQRDLVSSKEIEKLVSQTEKSTKEIKIYNNQLNEILTKYSFFNRENFAKLIALELFAIFKLLLVIPFYFILDRYMSFYLRERSFILLTDAEKSIQSKYLKNKSAGVLAVTATSVLAVILGIIATAIYEVLVW